MSRSSELCRLLPEHQKQIDDALKVSSHPRAVREILEKIANSYITTSKDGDHICNLHEPDSPGYNSKNMSDTRRHFFSHFPEGYPQCDACGHRTSQIANLRNHIRTQHPTQQDILIKKTSRRKSRQGSRPSPSFKRRTASSSTAYSAGLSQVKISQTTEVADDLPPLPDLTYSTPSPASSTDVELPIGDLDTMIDYTYTSEQLLQMFYSSASGTLNSPCNQLLSYVPLGGDSPTFDPDVCLNGESKQLDSLMWDSSSALYTSNIWFESSVLPPFSYIVEGLTQDC